MSSVPPGWANTTVPLYAGVLCGNVEQDTTYTTTSTTPEPIGFQTVSSWSDTQSLTSEDGFTWTCNTSGIYNLRCNQTLAVTNNYTPPDSAIPVIPNTVFYLDLSGTLSAPQIGNTFLHPITTTQSSVSFTTMGVGSDVQMATFTTPAGFLTSTVIPGGTWNLSLWADTDDETEVNNAYISIYAVDADGVSNPVLIQSGSANTFTLNSTVPYDFNHPFSVPTYTVADLTKRIQFRLFANFGIGSTVSFYFRDETLSSVETTISQDVVPPTQDVVDVRITVQSSTSELDQIFVSSLPITAVGNEVLLYNTSVNALANMYAGDTVDITVTAILGRVSVISETSEGGATNKFQWNLLAQGTYGNQTPIVPLMMMGAPEVPEVVVVPPMEFT